MIFFLTLTVRGPFHRKDFKWKKYGGTGLISEKTDVLYTELNERVEGAITGDSLQYIYSVPVSKNHRNIRSRCLVHEYSQILFNDIDHGYRAAILKKKSLWFSIKASLLFKFVRSPWVEVSKLLMHLLKWYRNLNLFLFYCFHWIK